MLTEPLWVKMFLDYRVPDTRPRWRRILSRTYHWCKWQTIGRFRAWLHRDCGGDY